MLAGLEAGELKLATFSWAEHADPLDAATIAAIAAGVSTRRYRTTLEPLPEGEQSSGRFQERGLAPVRSAQWRASGAVARITLDHVKLPVVMIDGIHFKKRVVLVALGFDTDARKHVLGIREGSTQNTRVVRSLICDLP